MWGLCLFDRYMASKSNLWEKHGRLEGLFKGKWAGRKMNNGEETYPNIPCSFASNHATSTSDWGHAFLITQGRRKRLRTAVQLFSSEWYPIISTEKSGELSSRHLFEKSRHSWGVRLSFLYFEVKISLFEIKTARKCCGLDPLICSIKQQNTFTGQYIIQTNTEPREDFVNN